MKILKEINSIITIAARDITLVLKTPISLLVTILMPVIMMGMLGGTLQQNMSDGLDFDYGKFMMIGMMVNMLFMLTNMGISSLVEDQTTDFTQEMMISPISRYSIILGKIIGSSFTSIVGLIGTLIVGFFMGITLTFGQLLSILALAPIICLSSGALTVIIIGSIKTTRTANIVVNLLVFPQMFLSGAIIPINNSEGILFILSRLMPMTYCLDLTRAVIYSGTKEYSTVMFNPFVNFIAILSISIICLIIGTLLFVRSEKNR